VGQEKPDAIADQIRGREVSADQQRLQIDPEFVIFEVSAIGLGLDHIADQIILWRLAARLHELSEIRIQLLAAGFHIRCLFRAAHWIESKNDAFRPIAKLRQSAFIDAENVRDDQDRDGHSDMFHQIKPARLRRIIDDLVDHRLNLWLHLLDPGIEGFDQRQAIAGMIRVVLKQDAGAASVRIVRVGQQARHGPLFGLARLAQKGAIIDRRADILIARQQPGLHRLVAQDGASLAQCLQPRMRIVTGFRIKSRDLNDAGWRFDRLCFVAHGSYLR